MVASAIAYFLAALFFFLGVVGVGASMLDDKIRAKGNQLPFFIVGVVAILMAWGFAKLGGI